MTEETDGPQDQGRGWLGLLTMILFLRSLFGFVLVFRLVGSSLQLLPDQPGPGTLILLLGVLRTGILLLGGYAAFLLFTLRKRAVMITYVFLVVNLIYWLLHMGVVWFVWNSITMQPVIIAAGLAIIVGWYLAVSKRIRATFYGATEQEVAQRWDPDASQHCPECKQQFTDKPKHCPDCNVSLEEIASS